MDTKTKDFLTKVDYLIGKGIIKDYKALVDALGWNKSVMSSVKNGKLPVPQHIYVKFRTMYEGELEPQVKEANDYVDDYITFLKEQNQFLKEQVMKLQERLKAVEEIKTNLNELAENQMTLGAIQQGWQEFWTEHIPLKKPKSLNEIKETIRKKASSSLQAFDEGGIRIF